MSKKNYLEPALKFSRYEDVNDVLASSGDVTGEEDFFDNPTPWAN